MKTGENLPMHIQFFLPILRSLRELGGSATPAELKEKLIELIGITEDELEDKLKSGVYRIDSKISWSKIYLERSGLLDGTNPDVLSQTEKGQVGELGETEVLAIFKKIHGALVAKKGKKEKELTDEIKDAVEDESHRPALLNILKTLPPTGFERLCQRLLRASGFKKVVVKGKSGDGGIDGEGILEINPLVSLKVIFQSKRYKDSVSSSQIRDFRGAMQGRAEKGIFITTGRFTSAAKAESIREGVPPIELVDGEKLVMLFEQRELGLKQKMVYEIDHSFFDEYR